MTRQERRRKERENAKAVEQMAAKRAVRDIQTGRSGVISDLELARIQRQINQMESGMGSLSGMTASAQVEFERRYAARQAKKKQLERNGITAEDLKENYDLGYEAGFKSAQEADIKVMFAAVCLALHKCFRFGQKRCYRVLDETFNHVIYSLDCEEAVEEVYKTIGLQIDFDDPIEPIKETK